MRRALVLPAIAAIAALPRLAVLVYERHDLLAGFIEKSDTFATTLVESGTYGLIPGIPSAYTQPLYGWLLAALYWTVGRSWWSVGLLHVALAVATVLLVVELGRRFVGPRAGAVAGLVVALDPYLVWHDVHVNREVLDGLVAVALVLLTLLAAERRSLPLAAATGAVAGLAILANTRLVLLPLLLAAFLGWRFADRRGAALAAGALLVASAVVVVPWVVRNHAQVGCATLTTDARALWKANNPSTNEVLAEGLWIDSVPPYPGRELTPDAAGDIYRQDGRVVRVDECEEMRFFQGEVLEFWREQPGEKARLAARGAAMLWDPRVTTTDENPGAGTWLDTVRTWPAALFFGALFALALTGLPRVPRPLAVLAVALLAYQTAMAMVFVGATRYRAPWDFLLALLAAAAVVELAPRVARRRRG